MANCCAAYDDGTIRWHRLADGQELLAFFPHADRKRWVLWTPSDYYDASPGGEVLIINVSDTGSSNDKPVVSHKTPRKQLEIPGYFCGN